ncbi:MAG: hypothetical protein ACON5A_01595 [Candidatus Comchoanobacterales bacterium]
MIDYQNCKTPEDLWLMVSQYIADHYLKWKDPYHTLSIAYEDSKKLINMATVVLRHFDPIKKTLTFHTDSRSMKMQAKLMNAMHYYPGLPIQVRYQGSVVFNHMDKTALDKWDQLTPSQQHCYQIEHAPATEITSPPHFKANGKAFFSMVTLKLTFIDILYLHHQGHIRSRLTCQDGVWNGVWLSP